MKNLINRKNQFYFHYVSDLISITNSPSFKVVSSWINAFSSLKSKENPESFAPSKLLISDSNEHSVNYLSKFWTSNSSSILGKKCGFISFFMSFYQSIVANHGWFFISAMLLNLISGFFYKNKGIRLLIFFDHFFS